MANSIYKMRKATSNGHKTYSLTVPGEIGERLNNRLFAVSVGEEGILFTPVEQNGNPDLTEQLNQASWATA